MRRYEILLPLRFNDGVTVPDDLVGVVLIALRDRFAAVSFETQTIRGKWQHEGRVYRDDLARIFVDVPETPDDRAWFIAFKERLKREFQQLDIWIVTYPIEVV